MTPNQKAILERLMDEQMSASELAADLHINAHNIKSTLRFLQRNGQVKQEGNYFTLAKDYNPPFEWNFKPLLGVWK